MFSPREATLRLAVLLRCWCSHHNNVRTVREGRHVCYCEVCAPVSSFPCFINSVVDVSRMSDHERGLEDDEEETTPTAKRPKFDQTESRVWREYVTCEVYYPEKSNSSLVEKHSLSFCGTTHGEHSAIWYDDSSSHTQSPKRVSHTFVCISTKIQKNLMTIAIRTWHCFAMASVLMGGFPTKWLSTL